MPTFEDIDRLVSSVRPDIADERDKLYKLEAEHREAYETLAPLLNNFHPNVAIAILHLRPSVLHSIIAELVGDEGIPHAGYSKSPLTIRALNLAEDSGRLSQALFDTPQFVRARLHRLGAPNHSNLHR